MPKKKKNAVYLTITDLDKLVSDIQIGSGIQVS